MVRHEAIRPHVDASCATPRRHQLLVGLVVVISEERALPAVATLRDVMGYAGHHDPCQSRHVATVTRQPALSGPALH